jgi:hypothetical protein
MPYKDPEVRRAYIKAYYGVWRLANRERILTAKAAYRERNREKLRVLSAEYLAENRKGKREMTA